MAVDYLSRAGLPTRGRERAAPAGGAARAGRTACGCAGARARRRSPRPRALLEPAWAQVQVEGRTRHAARRVAARRSTSSRASGPSAVSAERDARGRARPTRWSGRWSRRWSRRGAGVTLVCGTRRTTASPSRRSPSSSAASRPGPRAVSRARAGSRDAAVARRRVGAARDSSVSARGTWSSAAATAPAFGSGSTPAVGGRGRRAGLLLPHGHRGAARARRCGPTSAASPSSAGTSATTRQAGHRASPKASWCGCGSA